MRSLLILVVAAFTGCAGNDQLLGAFNSMFMGQEMQTSPNASTSNSSGNATLAITKSTTEGSYIVVIAQTDSGACTLRGTRDSKDSMTLNLPAAQTCHFYYNGAEAT